MKAVLDTNVLVSALMRPGFTRTLLIHPDLHLVMPEYALGEVRRHLPGIAERMGVAVDRAHLTVDLLLDRVETVPRAEYAAHMPRADALLADVDADDAPFAALAFATNRPLWTQDKALLNCPGLPTVATHEVTRELGIGTE